MFSSSRFNFTPEVDRSSAVNPLPLNVRVFFITFLVFALRRPVWYGTTYLFILHPTVPRNPKSVGNFRSYRRKGSPEMRRTANLSIESTTAKRAVFFLIAADLPNSVGRWAPPSPRNPDWHIRRMAKTLAATAVCADRVNGS